MGKQQVVAKSVTELQTSATPLEQKAGGHNCLTSGSTRRMPRAGVVGAWQSRSRGIRGLT